MASSASSTRQIALASAAKLPTQAAREHEKLILQERMATLQREIQQGRAAQAKAAAAAARGGAARAAAPPPSAAPAEPPPQGSWKEYWDADRQRHYYHNATTGETTWDAPRRPKREREDDDLDLVLASALGVVPNARAEDEGYGTAQYLDSEGSEGEGEYSDSEGGEEDWDDIDAVDRASSEALDALAASLASVPCRKGGTAVAGVRVQETRMPKKGGGDYWRIRVLCDTRYKPKSKEKAGQRICIARSEHSDRREARGAAEADAVAGLRAVSAGTTTLRELSAERRKHGEPQIDTRADKSGQPGFVVLDLEPGKQKGKKRQKGQPRKPQLWVRGPNGKEGHYATRTLRGLRVGPGDQLRWHSLPNPRHCYFTLDSRHPKNAHLGSWRGRGAS